MKKTMLALLLIFCLNPVVFSKNDSELKLVHLVRCSMYVQGNEYIAIEENSDLAFEGTRLACTKKHPQKVCMSNFDCGYVLTLN
ncbi:MAG: hypothetical protein ISR65_16840 [Bacteriovoracaceae bacterium]|nr:hypothetical protein [Bacteriovoracaceae bacterium]